MTEPPTRGGGDPVGGRPWEALAVTAFFAFAMVAGVLAIDPLRDAFGDAVRGDTKNLREDLRNLDAGGVAILYALIAIHTFVGTRRRSSTLPPASSSDSGQPSRW